VDRKALYFFYIARALDRVLESFEILDWCTTRINARTNII